MFDGTTIPAAAGYFSMGIVSLVFILIAERGRLFGVGEQYADANSEPVMEAH